MHHMWYMNYMSLVIFDESNMQIRDGNLARNARNKSAVAVKRDNGIIRQSSVCDPLFDLSHRDAYRRPPILSELCVQPRRPT